MRFFNLQCEVFESLWNGEIVNITTCFCLFMLNDLQVSRAPSGTERILTILRGQVHGRDKLPVARKHLQLLEVDSNFYFNELCFFFLELSFTLYFTLLPLEAFRPCSESMLRLCCSVLYNGCVNLEVTVAVHFLHAFFLLNCFSS